MERIPIEELAPLIKEVVDSGANFRLFPKGKSMYPTIVEGRDSVMLTKPDNLALYDAVFYRRSNGQYVLHRIVNVHQHGTFFDMCGDNQLMVEKGIPSTAVVAKVCGIYKMDDYHDVNDEAYQRAIRKLYRSKPIKRFLFRVKNKIKHLFHV